MSGSGNGRRAWVLAACTVIGTALTVGGAAIALGARLWADRDDVAAQQRAFEVHLEEHRGHVREAMQHFASPRHAGAASVDDVTGMRRDMAEIMRMVRDVREAVIRLDAQTHGGRMHGGRP